MTLNFIKQSGFSVMCYIKKRSKEWYSYNEKAPGIHWNTLENS